METAIDLKKCLSAFARITQSGDKTGKGYFWHGVYADTLDDGYTLILTDGAATLTLFFHNTYALDAPDSQAMDRLVRRIHAIAVEP